MQKEDCFLLGHISRAHGYKGDLVAVFDTDQPERYNKLESVFVEQHGELVPFFISRIDQNSKGHFILTMEDVDATEAQALIGKNLWLPLNLLPPLSGKNFYFHEVLGFKIIDLDEGFLGTCEDILETAAQPLFKVFSSDREFLIPAVDDIIQEIDRDRREIIVKCPEGLLDLFN